jgi:predicted CoA-binding protein
VTYKEQINFDAATAVHLPVSERVLDKLADILFATDEILDMFRGEEAVFDERSVAVEESVKCVYNQINELMKTLAD